MKNIFLVSLFLCSHSFAQKPKWLEVEKKLEVNIPAIEAWELIKDYNGMTKWHPRVAKSEIIEGVDNSVGCIRKLNFLNGLILYERLLNYDPSKMMIGYDIHRIENGSFPVSSYKANLQVESFGNNKSILVWKSKFKRYDTRETPSLEGNDEKALGVVNKIYDIAFNNITQYVENKKMIITQLNNYAQGATLGDRTRVKGAFEKNATVKFIREEELIDLTIDEFLIQYIKDGALLDRTYKIDFIDIRQNVATAKITIDYKTHQFIDYFTLIKDKKSWAIVSKVFTRVNKTQ